MSLALTGDFPTSINSAWADTHLNIPQHGPSRTCSGEAAGWGAHGLEASPAWLCTERWKAETFPSEIWQTQLTALEQGEGEEPRCLV